MSNFWYMLLPYWWHTLVGCVGFKWILSRTNLYFNLSNGVNKDASRGGMDQILLVTWQIKSKTSRLVDFRPLQSSSPLFPLKFLFMEFCILKNCPITRKMINQQGSCRIFLNCFWSHFTYLYDNVFIRIDWNCLSRKSALYSMNPKVLFNCQKTSIFYLA